MKELAATDRVALELRGREPIFHRLPRGAARESVAALVDPDYFEVGASGRVYDLDLVLGTVTDRYARGAAPDDETWRIDDFAVRDLGDALFLVTYALHHHGTRSRRSTVWQQRDGRFTALYHQGTPAPEATPEQPRPR